MGKTFLAGTALVLLTFVAFVFITVRAGVGVNGATPTDGHDVLASNPANQTLSRVSTIAVDPKVAVSPTMTTTCDPVWHLVSSPNFASGSNFLFGVKEVAPDDVWAVGYYTSTDSISRTLTLHWNGTDWNIVPSPNTEAHDNILRSVSASASNDVWAVGYSANADAIRGTLTLHWDGTQWSIVPSPNTTSPENVLQGVTSVGADDVWAVGYHENRALIFTQTLTMHWDGTTWTVVSSPDTGTRAILYAITSLASDYVWAVGFYVDGNSIGQTLTLHWDGTQWDIVPSPNGPGNSTLTAVDAHTANDIWAVGNYFHGPQESPPLVEHWDGSQWSIVPSPWFGGSYYELNAVVALASDDAWILGNRDVDPSFILHWDGSQWSITLPDRTLFPTVPYGADGLSSTDIWAVGGYFGVDSGGVIRSRILRYDGTCAPSGTPTPTPTTCPIQFSDVPAGSTFYPFVRCLACRGIVSGYPDGTFRPSNPSTRGQTAKIISNAASLIDDPGPQLFQDVPPSSTFYTYTQRLANMGIVSGYPCGGAGEPCLPPDGLPYFRPGNENTRGQVSKIVSYTFFLDCYSP
ncbi:MAG TPA: S-layer homology domain-containing protein [Chloroflexia bacterium]|nr:S-layer homology domain-containing protein [Chloroflexia bacterium]